MFYRQILYWRVCIYCVIYWLLTFFFSYSWYIQVYPTKQNWLFPRPLLPTTQVDFDHSQAMVPSSILVPRPWFPLVSSFPGHGPPSSISSMLSVASFPGSLFSSGRAWEQGYASSTFSLACFDFSTVRSTQLSKVDCFLTFVTHILGCLQCVYQHWRCQCDISFFSLPWLLAVCEEYTGSIASLPSSPC